MLDQLIRYSVFIVIIVLGFSCSPKKENPKQLLPSSTQQLSKYSGQVLRLENTSFYAYQIKKDGKLLINQSFVPAIQGKLPIEDSISAVQLMEISLEKINGGQFPPSLSIQEVKKCLNTQN
jgi:hypothetical protein